MSSASYIRTESTTSGLGSSVRDSVSVQHNWDISEFWKLALRGDWVRREATARAPGEVDNSDITSWGARVQLNRRLTRHLRAGVRYSYNKQSSSGRVVGGFSDFDNHLVTIGLQYDFDQFSLDPYVPW